MQERTKVKIIIILREVETGISRILVKFKRIKVVIGNKEIMEEDKILTIKAGMREDLVIKEIMEGKLLLVNLAGKIIRAFLKIK